MQCAPWHISNASIDESDLTPQQAPMRRKKSSRMLVEAMAATAIEPSTAFSPTVFRQACGPIRGEHCALHQSQLTCRLSRVVWVMDLLWNSFSSASYTQKYQLLSLLLEQFLDRYR